MTAGVYSVLSTNFLPTTLVLPRFVIQTTHADVFESVIFGKILSDQCEEKHRLIQKSPLDVRNFFSVLATPLLRDRDLPDAMGIGCSEIKMQL